MGTLQPYMTIVTMISDVLVVVTGIVALLFFSSLARLFKSQSKAVFPPKVGRTLADAKRDKKAREWSREATLKRLECSQVKRRKQRKAYKQKQLKNYEQMVCIPTGTNYNEFPAESLPIFNDGLTKYRHMMHLANGDSAKVILNRIAREFNPIIRQRGYDVASVTEFCCCGDGLDYELGGHSSCVRPGCKIAGSDPSHVYGYNETRLLNRGRTAHTIHLRLREPNNHDTLLDYGTVARTMAHELAHCVHGHHEPPFYQLMNEIIQHHAVVVRDLQLGTNDASAWTTPQAEWESECFNTHEATTTSLYG